MGQGMWTRPRRRRSGRLALPALREDAPRSVVLSGRPILLVHGLGTTSRSLRPLERGLRHRLGRPVCRVALGRRLPVQLQDVRRSAERIHALVAESAARPGFEYLDIAAHSLGGLVACYVLKKLDCGGWIRNVVTLGTPHRGTPAAVPAILLLGWLSRAIRQVVPGSPLTRELLTLPVPRGSRLISIGGGRDRLVPPAWCRLPRAPRHWNFELAGADHWDLVLTRRALHVVVRALDPELGSSAPQNHRLSDSSPRLAAVAFQRNS